MALSTLDTSGKVLAVVHVVICLAVGTLRRFSSTIGLLNLNSSMIVILGRRAFQYLTVFKAKEETWDFYNSFLSISFDKCIGHLLRFKL